MNFGTAIIAVGISLAIWIVISVLFAMGLNPDTERQSGMRKALIFFLKALLIILCIAFLVFWAFILIRYLKG